MKRIVRYLAVRCIAWLGVWACIGPGRYDFRQRQNMHEIIQRDQCKMHSSFCCGWVHILVLDEPHGMLDLQKRERPSGMIAGADLWPWLRHMDDIERLFHPAQ